MNKKAIVTLIAIALMLFVAVKVLFNQLCAPMPNNVVTQAVSNALSVAPSTPTSSKPEPLSWEPVMQQLLAFFSKACSP
jgi:hypothetical protein